jgi:PhnB protein
MTGPEGVVAHAEIEIGGSVIMLGDERLDGPTLSPKSLNGSTASLFIYTDDVDALWNRAVAAGCEVVYPLEMQFYGDKGGRLRDPFGHTWGLGQHMEDVSDEEMASRMEAFYTE